MKSTNIVQGSCILIVEDEEDMRDYLGELLSDDYTVALASQGQEAIHLLETKEIDLIISDISMPEMDGFEFLHQLREELQQLMPVLFLTGHTERDKVLKALLLGVDSYVTKPFESEELLARVQGLLSNNRRRKALYARLVEQQGLQNGAGETSGEGVASFRTRWLKQLEEVLKKEISNANIKVPDLAYQMAVSERTFRNRVKEFTGLTPHEYIMEARLNKALYLLEHQVYPTVSEVAYAIGLNHSSYFTTQFKERFGKTPSEYL